MLSPGNLFSQGVSSTNAPPVTIRHVKTNEFERFPKMGMVFSATNYTDQAVSLTAPAIEVKTGSKWIEQGGPNLQCIVFTGPGCPIHLSPHQAAYFVIEFSTRVPGSSPGVNYLPQEPTGTPWRLRLNVQDNLTGLADASARVKRASATIKDQLGGNTNSSITKFFLQRPPSLASPKLWSVKRFQNDQIAQPGACT